MILLTADWHLTDNPDEEYRWEIFKSVRRWLRKYEKLVICGDLTDRKDRHPAALLNRVLGEFRALAQDFPGRIVIFPGNHDLPLVGDSFWTFLGEVRGLEFISEPAEWYDGEVLVLPFTEDPVTAWADFDFDRYKAVLMHQPVDGARDAGSPKAVKGKPFPDLPRHLRIYSGDIHTPQAVKGVVYIGAPHPVKFGDRYECRMLVVDPNGWEIADEITMDPISRFMLTINDVAELEEVHAGAGDQAKVVCNIGLSQMGQWPAMRDAIYGWAERQEVRLFSVQPTVVLDGGAALRDEGAETWVEPLRPLDTLISFAEHEAIDEVTLELGAQFLEQAEKQRAAR